MFLFCYTKDNYAHHAKTLKKKLRWGSDYFHSLFYNSRYKMLNT